LAKRIPVLKNTPPWGLPAGRQGMLEGAFS